MSPSRRRATNTREAIRFRQRPRNFQAAHGASRVQSASVKIAVAADPWTAPWREVTSFASHSEAIRRLRLHFHRRADLDVIVEKFGSLRGHADAAVRGRITRKDSDVHADAFTG